MHMTRYGFLATWIAGAAFAGNLTDRAQLTLDRVLKGGPPQYTEELVLADAVPRHVRRFTEFSGDVSGRYIEALAVWARTKPALRAPLDALVTKLLTYQKEDGHFGDAFNTAEATDADMAILWGNGRLLIGLAEYYKLNPRADVLAAARRMGDFLVRVAPLFNSDAVRARYNGEKFAVGYICWTQNIEGLVALSRATREEKYLALAREMAARTDRHPAQHSHGYLTSLRGIVDLYRATGEARYLAQVEKEWQGLAASGNLMLQGGGVGDVPAADEARRGLLRGRLAPAQPGVVARDAQSGIPGGGGTGSLQRIRLQPVPHRGFRTSHAVARRHERTVRARLVVLHAARAARHGGGGRDGVSRQRRCARGRARV
jgi:hypothetical protein